MICLWDYLWVICNAHEFKLSGFNIYLISSSPNSWERPHSHLNVFHSPLGRVLSLFSFWSLEIVPNSFFKIFFKSFSRSWTHLKPQSAANNNNKSHFRLSSFSFCAIWSTYMVYKYDFWGFKLEEESTVFAVPYSSTTLAFESPLSLLLGSHPFCPSCLCSKFRDLNFLSFFAIQCKFWGKL